MKPDFKNKKFIPRYNKNYRMVFSEEKGLEDDFCVIFIDEKSKLYGAAIHFDDMKSDASIDVKFSVLKNPVDVTCDVEIFKDAVKKVFIDIIDNIAKEEKLIISRNQDIIAPEKKIIIH